MLDPTRFALNAATVGFRKRTGQTVDWNAFHNAIQNQTDAIKVRREEQETLVSELHVMGGQRFGIEGNSKTNELARQQRQMNGYPLRSFLATGGPVILPPKHGEGLMATPMNLGRSQYSTYNAVQGQSYVSKFTEPLNAPLENNSILLGRAGIQAYSESASDPYKAMNFLNNMHQSLDQIRANERAHLERRGFHRQEIQQDDVTKLQRQAALLAEQQARTYQNRQQPSGPPIPPPRGGGGGGGGGGDIKQKREVPQAAPGEEVFPMDYDAEIARAEGIQRTLYGGEGEKKQESLSLSNDSSPVAMRVKENEFRNHIYEEFGEDVLNEIEEIYNQNKPRMTFMEASEQYAMSSPIFQNKVRQREMEVKKQRDELMRSQMTEEEIAKDAAHHAELSAMVLVRDRWGQMRAQYVIASDNLQDAGGSSETVGAVIANQARTTFEKIGQSANGLSNNPEQNSAPSSANLQQKVQGEPFRIHHEMLTDMFNDRNYKVPGPQPNWVHVGKIGKKTSLVPTLQEMEAEFNASSDPNQRQYLASRIGAAKHSRAIQNRANAAIEAEENPKKRRNEYEGNSKTKKREKTTRVITASVPYTPPPTKKKATTKKTRKN